MIENYNEFAKFVFERKRELLNETGDCNTCPKRKKCRDINKRKTIDDIIKMKKGDTRFPMLLSVVKKHSWVLDVIPCSIYEKQYGFFTDYLPCPFASKEIVENIKKIEYVWHNLSDDCSKKIFIRNLMYRITLDEKYIKACFCNESQYFIKDYCGLNNNEVVIDCGGYIGDTLIDYMQYNLEPKKYFIYEPDKRNIELLKDTIKKYKNTEFIISTKGLYKENGELWFASGNGSSSFTSLVPLENGNRIDVVSIDDDIDESITFIKMDIEGFEQDALKGCVKHITRSLPKLAISSYHTIHDIWDIPYMIIKENYGYNCFLMRHYSDSFRESVFYSYVK